MLKILRNRSTLSRSLVWAATLALVLGFSGHLYKNLLALPMENRDPQTIAKVVLDTIPAAIKVFRTKPRAEVGSEGWVLTIAETLGALVAFAAVLALLGSVLREQVEKFRISFLKKHTILLGFDRQARLFLKSKMRPRKLPVVLLDPTASEKTRRLAHAEGCLHFATDSETELAAQLNACRVGRSERIIISAGTDSENLEIVKDIAESGVACPADVVLNIRDVALHRQLEASDGFMQKLGTDVSLRLFNYPKAAAVDLLSRTNFTRLADLQGQDQVHLMVFGETLEAVEVITHYLRASPSLLSKRPKISWVVPARASALKLLSLNYPPLANLLNAKDSAAPLAWCVDFDLFETGEGAAAYDEVFLARLLGDLPSPTAIVVAQDNAEKSNVLIGLALQETAKRVGPLQAPVFVFSQKGDAADQFLRCQAHLPQARPVSQKKLKTSQDLSEVLEPFGRSDEVCSWGTADSLREDRARSLHVQYLKDRESEGRDETDRTDSMRPWAELSETYKNANRRAADQMAVLAYAREQLLASRQTVTSADVERLAALEHDAWWIDRELDGWRYGDIRDNRRKLHPNLVPYDRLSDDIQEYDRAKVRQLPQFS